MKQFYPSCHSKNLDQRASPEEEFFKLSCLALKIKYSERQDHSKGEDHFDVSTISDDKLYKLCQKEQIAFHKWSDWIEEQI